MSQRPNHTTMGLAFILGCLIIAIAIYVGIKAAPETIPTNTTIAADGNVADSEAAPAVASDNATANTDSGLPSAPSARSGRMRRRSLITAATLAALAAEVMAGSTSTPLPSVASGAIVLPIKSRCSVRLGSDLASTIGPVEGELFFDAKGSSLRIARDGMAGHGENQGEARLSGGSRSLWPDAGGMQHSEVQAVRDGRLWWVPRWAPAWLREGWPYAERPASGGPVHPSVHWRFAVGDVVQGLSTGPYRPHALRTDARFAHFYDGTPAASAETLAAAARWRLTCDGCGILADGAAAPDLDRFLASKGASEAIVVTVVGPTDPRDDYAVGLVLRELDRALASTGMQSLPVAADVEGLVGPVGRLVLQVSSADGRSIARSFGRPWFLTIASDGFARVVPAFD